MCSRKFAQSTRLCGPSSSASQRFPSFRRSGKTPFPRSSDSWTSSARNSGFGVRGIVRGFSRVDDVFAVNPPKSNDALAIASRTSFDEPQVDDECLRRCALYALEVAMPWIDQVVVFVLDDAARHLEHDRGGGA